MAFAVLAANPETEAGVLLVTESLFDVLQPIVAARASLCTHAKCAEGDGQLVNDDQEIFFRYSEALHPVGDSLSAQVHVRGGFDQMHAAPFVFEFRLVRVTARGEVDAMFVRKLVKHKEA